MTKNHFRRKHSTRAVRYLEQSAQARAMAGGYKNDNFARQFEIQRAKFLLQCAKQARHLAG